MRRAPRPAARGRTGHAPLTDRTAPAGPPPRGRNRTPGACPDVSYSRSLGFNPGITAERSAPRCLLSRTAPVGQPFRSDSAAHVVQVLRERPRIVWNEIRTHDHDIHVRILLDEL